MTPEVYRKHQVFLRNGCTHFAFWNYDVYPYVLCSGVRDVTMNEDCSITAYSPSYGGFFKPQYITEDIALAISYMESLEILQREYTVELKKLKKNFDAKVITEIPFMKNFKAFKK